MTARTNPFVAAPHLVQQLVDYAKTLVVNGLEPSLLNLLAIRVSQINGSAPSLQRYFSEARQQDEDNERLDLLSAWRTTQIYSDRERAALAWSEVLTRLPETQAPDDDYAAVKAHFSEEEEVRLTLLICVFNSFNRLAVGHRVQPQAQPRPQAA